MQLSSPAFGNNQPIPDAYTMKGAGISPPLVIADVPVEAKSLALIMHDPDAPNGDFLHWALWNLPSDITSMDEGKTPNGAIEGTNDYGRPGYGQPAPPSGTHRYVFDLYAFDVVLSMPPGGDQTELATALSEHLVAQAQLVGTVSA